MDRSKVDLIAKNRWNNLIVVITSKDQSPLEVMQISCEQMKKMSTYA